MDTPIIQFQNVSKSYKIIKNKETTLKEKIMNRLKGKKEEIFEKKVLSNFSFDINRGNTIGIIGENGAGKSTTLKLIANIIQPDCGKILVKGKIASLLEIGAGFQADMTGRENVYLYGTILGLSKSYLDSKYDKIVEFAELQDFMDTPVKNYSSGMYMRLAFSVAIHVDPEIILIDEVLAVGDINFQKKCIDKLEEFQQKGKTIVFVSHDMTSVRKLCDQVVYIYNNGEYKIGAPDQMVNLYFSRVYNLPVENEEQDNDYQNPELDVDAITLTCLNPNKSDRVRWGNRKAQILEVTLGQSNGQITNIFEAGQDIVINIKGIASDDIDKLVIGIAIYDEDGVNLSGPNSKDDGVVFEKLNGIFYSRVILRNPPFLQGTYPLTVAFYDQTCRQPYDHMEKYFVFHVNNIKAVHGKVLLKCDWII